MKNWKTLLLVILLFSCTPNENVQNKGSRNRRYLIVISHKEKISGFSFEDTNDTLLLLLPIKNPRTLYKLIIDDETKIKIRDVMRYHFDIANFKAGKDDNKGGSVTFEVSSPGDIHTRHDTGTITTVCKSIYKNTDVSAAYSELIIYLKGKYPEFKNWPD